MKLTSALVLLFSLILFLQDSRGSRCLCTTSTEPTREGANENIVIAEPEKYRQLAGVVHDLSGQILSGGWNHTQMYIVIAAAKQKASTRSLEITMQPGT